MSRLQLALNVDDLATSLAFYTTLFDTPPAKVKPGYANFAITEPPLKLVLIENPGHGGTVNHLGVEAHDVDTVDATRTRLAAHGLASVEEREQTCCYAKQTKFWVQDTPNDERWEIYTVLEDSDTFSGEPTEPTEVTENTENAENTDNTGERPQRVDAREASASGCGTAVNSEPAPTAAACC
jgi:catechol 2,3-dioxygenase-like lactoylglutathione lyase family enzyme